MELEYTVSNYNRSDPDRHRQSSVYARDNYIRKAVVSTRDKASLVVMVIAGQLRELYLCRREMEDNTWIPVQCVQNDFYDLTYYNGKFYAINLYGNVVVVEGLDSRNPYAEAVIEYEKYEDEDEDIIELNFRLSYLIESSGELLKVVRFIKHKEPSKTFFKRKPPNLERLGAPNQFRQDYLAMRTAWMGNNF
ncbi:hypothetical protein FRX31_029665 [Thalictrum thalictroides]|uniref:KIB1-4 beta-propeller domain-containing protein n=1 Tax=Thalictrum thalictroides TaxID=46969 RepID=A0A7J6V6U4_THATH|nr:hypothetical protein FRX31_029665 [Thalictrum thalictroides]